MHDLTPQTALGSTAPATVTIGGLSITENPGLALASVAARQGQESACRDALKSWLGAEVPAPGQAALSPQQSAVWMAPDQWLLTAPFDTFEEIVSALVPVFKNSASITEQTDAWVCFDVEGAAVVDMFERLCAMPIRSARTGAAQRTVIHHLGCFVICMDGAMTVRVLGPRSSAGSLHHALTTAAEAVT